MKIIRNISILLLFISIYQIGFAQKVFVLEIKQEIDPRMSRYVTIALEEATKINADVVVVDMNTFGGAVDDADKIRTALLEYKKPVWVFINKNAASAGALISIACDSIYMQSGSSIGAATVVNGKDGQAMPDKYQSYMRSMMRATAEKNNRNPLIAEAMVDPEVVLEDSIKKTGKVLTFTTKEAIKYGFCEAEIQSIEDILKRNKMPKAEIITYQLSNTEKIIAFFLNPAISGILILIMIGGIYFELQTPGFGFPIIAGLIAAILYFTPYYLNGLAQNWEILMFLVGIILLGIEIFVIPGFGFVGISGLVCIFAALILSMLNNDFLNFYFVKTNDLYTAMLSVLISFIFTVVIIVYGSRKLMQSDRFKKISLGNTSIAAVDFEEKENHHYIHKTGITLTSLRPSGKVVINDEVFDAISSGEYIEAQVEVKVLSVLNTTLKVKEC